MDEKQKIERILDWFNGKKKPPYTIELRPTNNCNLKCLSCAARGKEEYIRDEELDIKAYIKLIREAAELGTIHFHLSGGGEPLARYEVTKEIMYQIKKNGMEGSIVTNGTLFKDELIKKLVEIEWDYISFSIDGPNKEVHDKLRGVNGVFERSTEVIKKFTYWKKFLNKSNPRLVICTVISSYNHDLLLQFLELCEQTGAREVLFQPLNVKEGNLYSKDLVLTKDMKKIVLKQLPEIKKIAEKKNIKTNIEDIDGLMIDKSCEIKKVIEEDSKKHKKDDILHIPCFYPWYFLGVRANGIAQPCGVSSEGEILPNIKNSSLKDIWYGEFFSNFRKKIMADQIPLQCKNCCGASVLSIRQIRDKIKQR